MVCRAFKKPSSSHKQSYEAWSHAYLVRHSSHLQPPSFPAPISPIMHTEVPQNQAFYQQYFDSEQDLMYSHGNFNNQEITEIPQLESPTTLSTSFATKEVFEQNGLQNDELFEDGLSDRAKQCIDWTSSLSSLLPQSYDQLGAQNPSSHLLGCFPDL